VKNIQINQLSLISFIGAIDIKERNYEYDYYVLDVNPNSCKYHWLLWKTP